MFIYIFLYCSCKAPPKNISSIISKTIQEYWLTMLGNRLRISWLETSSGEPALEEVRKQDVKPFRVPMSSQDSKFQENFQIPPFLNYWKTSNDVSVYHGKVLSLHLNRWRRFETVKFVLGRNSSWTILETGNLCSTR